MEGSGQKQLRANDRSHSLLVKLYNWQENQEPGQHVKGEMGDAMGHRRGEDPAVGPQNPILITQK